ncbi:hypothetical protein [Sphingomonas aerophila]|uniref:hypothetical protein n=1 Tax=Sphingomonas aerophila TaxID=1344948 RepID=UPI001C85B12F|nr:hypothetical protein [Sphingomonas aerophila]
MPDKIECRTVSLTPAAAHPPGLSMRIDVLLNVCRFAACTPGVRRRRQLVRR